jgi:hypothetical protein
MTPIRKAVLWHAAALISLTQLTLSPLNGQVADTPETARLRGGPERNIVLYQGPLVHDQQWVMRSGTTNTNLLGVFGGNCSLVPSNVRNLSGFEQVRFEYEHQGLGVWKMAHVDTVYGTAVAETGQRYRYTYNLRRSVTGITTDGKPPSPNRAVPTSTNPGFLDPVPSNVESAALKFEDFFLLIDEATGRVVADAQVLGWFHRRIDPAEQPPSFFPFVLDGYIATTLETIAGQAGCDPL